MLRHSHLIARRSAVRHASTTSKATEAASNTASKAKETTSSATSKAPEGLSKVTSSAGPALSNAAQGVGNYLGKIGGRTGKLIAYIETLIPPTVYYSKVTFELSRMVFQAQKMSPPNLSAFQTHLQPMINVFRRPSSLLAQKAESSSTTSPEQLLRRVRNIDRAQLARGGVIFAEVLGFFTVGEMIGRMKLVGYRGDVHHHETATPHEGL